MSCWAIVPVKARVAGKQRLAHALPESTRAMLVRVMLEQVLGAVRSSAKIDGVLVMTPDRDNLPEAIGVLPDAGAGLNAALQDALPALLARGATRVAIVSADLPLLSADDVTALVVAGEAAAISFAPDHTTTGTNAACLALPTSFRFEFGPGSFARHLAQATRVGHEAACVTREGLAFDVDVPADVEKLRARADARYGFLA